MKAYFYHYCLTIKQRARLFTSFLANLIMASLLVQGITGCSSGIPFSKPTLLDEDILSMLNDEGVVQEPTISTTWIDDSPFSVTDEAVDDISDVGSEGTEKQAAVTVVLANEFVESTQHYGCNYLLSDKEWVLIDSWLIEEEIVPLAGVDADKVVDQALTLIAQADDGEHKYADGKSCQLDKIYSENAEFTVAKNDTNKNGGSVTLSMNSSTGFVSYSGDLIAKFEWDEDLHGWSVAECTVNDDAYLPKLDDMLGTWEGEFVSTKNVEHSNGDCYGAKDKPMKLVVKSADSQTGTITADLTFLAHCHYREDNPIPSSEGDKTITLENILIPVPYSTGSSVTAYKKEPPERGFEFTKYEITFAYDADATIQASVRFMWGENDDGASAWYTDTYVDNYKLKKTA